MLAVCPKCKTELDAEFGMTKCPACGAFSFVGEDGIARAPEDEAPPIESVARPATGDDAGVDSGEASAVSGFGAGDLGFAPFDPGSSGPAGFEPVPFEAPEISEEPPSAFDLAPSSVVDVVADSADDSAYGTSPFDPPSGFDVPPSPEAPMENFGMDSFQSPEAASPISSDGESERPPMAFGPADDPLNLNEFANSEVSSGRDGPLLYRLLISGIDTKEIRESIREVLNDDRFRLDAAAVLGRVSKGDLVIDGLSPVKASILVNRIKRLPISIRWEQYAITEANL